MATQSIQSKSLVGAALVIGCLVGAYFLYSNIWPAYAEAKLQLDAAELENDRLTKALNSIQQFVKDYEAEVQKAPTVDLALPSKTNDLANFISTLSNLGSQSGVALAGFQVIESSAKAPENTIQPIDIIVNFSGTYLSLKDFIGKLENNLRLVDITSVSLAAQQNNVGTALLAYQIKMKTYFQQ